MDTNLQIFNVGIDNVYVYLKLMTNRFISIQSHSSNIQHNHQQMRKEVRPSSFVS